MDVQDGFILGIYNYCDRWCETCAFTSRCRGFADHAESEAEHDSRLEGDCGSASASGGHTAAATAMDAGAHRGDEQMSRSEPISDEEYTKLCPEIPPEHKCIEARAHAYADRVHAWLESRDVVSTARPTRSVRGGGVVSILDSRKNVRALQGLAWDEPEERDWPATTTAPRRSRFWGWSVRMPHGSSSRTTAWRLRPRSSLSSPILIWLSDELARVFPNARAFVRPGFDEPDKVAKLLAAEGSGS